MLLFFKRSLRHLQADNTGNTYGSMELAKEIASDEVAHVRFLRAALGPAAIKCPKMNISGEKKGAFNLAALAALNITADEQTVTFDPYKNDLFFLHGAFIFEDVGVTAYTGAVPAAIKLKLEPGTFELQCLHLNSEHTRMSLLP